MKKPIIIINLKTYKEGKDALALTKSIESFDKKIIVGVMPTDINLISSKTKLPIYSQHCDVFEHGRNTGFITPESVKAAGAIGTFLNHSEHKLDFETIKKTIERCKGIGLKVAIFASNLEEAINIKSLNPEYIIIEPPELVAGDVSVSKARPELIKEISSTLNHPFLVGAGIKTKDDINLAMNLGASGVAFASVITNAKNPKKVLKELLKE